MSVLNGIIIALILDILVLWFFTIVFPNEGTLRQNAVIFVAQGFLGWRDFMEDVTTIVMANDAKYHMTPKQRMNGMLDEALKDMMPRKSYIKQNIVKE